MQCACKQARSWDKKGAHVAGHVSYLRLTSLSGRVVRVWLCKGALHAVPMGQPIPAIPHTIHKTPHREAVPLRLSAGYACLFGVGILPADVA